jgi:hypothetical protein
MTAPLIASFAMSGLPGDPCSWRSRVTPISCPSCLMLQVVDFTQDG